MAVIGGDGKKLATKEGVRVGCLAAPCRSFLRPPLASPPVTAAVVCPLTVGSASAVTVVVVRGLSSRVYHTSLDTRGVHEQWGPAYFLYF
jgi:hypothetical protein